MVFRSVVRTLVICLAAPAALARADIYTPGFFPLGPIAGQGGGEALGISGDGHVVVGWTPIGSSSVAPAAWHDGTGVQLGPSSQYNPTDARGASHDGSVAVGTQVFSGLNYAMKWEGGHATQLVSFTQARIASATSADSSVIVGYGNPDAFRLDATGFHLLGHLPGHSTSYATGVSADGQVVVGTSAYDASRINPGKAVRWEAGQTITLADLTGYSFRSEATDVSPDGGSVVGRSVTSGNYASRACLWRGSSVVDLGVLPVGNGLLAVSDAAGVSAGGTVVVGRSGWLDTTLFNLRDPIATIWTPELGLLDLKQYLVTRFGMNLSGWTLTEARGVSDDGRVITGIGRDPSGRGASWYAVVPCPSTSVMCICGAGLACRRRRR